MIGRHKFAVLYFDKDTEKIGIRLIDDANEDGVMSVVKGIKHVSIYAVAFLSHFCIDYTTTRLYPLEFDKEANMYVINLKYPTAKARRKNKSISF